MQLTLDKKSEKIGLPPQHLLALGQFNARFLPETT